MDSRLKLAGMTEGRAGGKDKGAVGGQEAAGGQGYGGRTRERQGRQEGWREGQEGRREGQEGRRGRDRRGAEGWGDGAAHFGIFCVRVYDGAVWTRCYPAAMWKWK